MRTLAPFAFAALLFPTFAATQSIWDDAESEDARAAAEAAAMDSPAHQPVKKSNADKINGTNGAARPTASDGTPGIRPGSLDGVRKGTTPGVRPGADSGTNNQ